MENSLHQTLKKLVGSIPFTGNRSSKAGHWSLGKVYLVNAVFSTVVAVIIWLAVPGSDNPGFLNNWVHAQFIGGIICSLVLLTNCAVRRYSSLPDRLLLFVMPLNVAIGFFLGTALARLVLQLPSIESAYYNDRHILVVSLAITVVVTAAITWFFTAQSTITDLRVRSAEESERAAQAHLAMLIAQVEPHMLFNTLANLKALIPDEPEKACAMLDSLIEFLRATLSHSRESSVTLESECRILESYLTIMKIRLEDRLSHEIVIPESLQQSHIPSLLLQPLVENAITHGIEPAVDGGHIRVEATSIEGILTLVVEDTGIGIANLSAIESQLGGEQPHTGLGLANVRARCISLPAGDFKLVSPLPNDRPGTRLTLTLPLVFAA